MRERVKSPNICFLTLAPVLDTAFFPGYRLPSHIALSHASAAKIAQKVQFFLLPQCFQLFPIIKLSYIEFFHVFGTLEVGCCRFALWRKGIDYLAHLVQMWYFPSCFWNIGSRLLQICSMKERDRLFSPFSANVIFSSSFIRIVNPFEKYNFSLKCLLN